MRNDVLAVRGLMPLLIQRRNEGGWSVEDRERLRTCMKRLSVASPYLVVLVMPGGLLLVPVPAWWLDRRSRRRNGGADAIERPTPSARVRLPGARYFEAPPELPELPDSVLPPVVPVVAPGEEAAPSLVAAGELAGELGSTLAAGGGATGVLGLVVLGVVVVLADLFSSLPQP